MEDYSTKIDTVKLSAESALMFDSKNQYYVMTATGVVTQEVIPLNWLFGWVKSFF